MFRRLLIEDSATVFTVVAFIVAASIFFSFAWRALRMKRRQCEELEQLPFNTPTPASGSGFTPDSSALDEAVPGINADPHSDESR